MTLEITNPEAIAEIEHFVERFNIPASVVVERVMIEMGSWVPTEVLAYPPKSETRAQDDKGCS
jgi:hypothetical protein